jgi:hypothetical protein
VPVSRKLKVQCQRYRQTTNNEETQNKIRSGHKYKEWIIKTKKGATARRKEC